MNMEYCCFVDADTSRIIAIYPNNESHTIMNDFHNNIMDLNHDLPLCSFITTKEFALELLKQNNSKKTYIFPEIENLFHI